MKFFKIRQSLLLLIIVLAFGVKASAVDNVRFVMDQNAKAFSLYLTSQVKRVVAISIQDESGVVLWEENFLAEGKFAKKYNLDQLPDGNYFAHVSDQTKNIIQPLIINQGTVSIYAEDRKVNYKPMVFQNDRQLSINWFTAGKDVTVTLTDQNGNMLIEKTFNEGNTLHKRFNLTQLPEGTYTLRLAMDKCYHYQEVICN